MKPLSNLKQYSTTLLIAAAAVYFLLYIFNYAESALKSDTFLLETVQVTLKHSIPPDMLEQEPYQSIQLIWFSPGDAELDFSRRIDSDTIVFTQERGLVRSPVLYIPQTAAGDIESITVQIADTAFDWQFDPGGGIHPMPESFRIGRLPLPVLQDVRNVPWITFAGSILFMSAVFWLVLAAVLRVLKLRSCRSNILLVICFLTLQSFLSAPNPVLGHLTGFFAVFTLPLLWQTRGKLQLTQQTMPVVSTQLYVLAAVLVALLAVFVRIYGLALLDPYVDEYYHFTVGQQLADGEAYSYTRAMLISSLSALSYRMAQPESMQEYIFWGRMPSAVIGGVTVLMFFWFGRKFSRTAGSLAGSLWAVWPWAFALARTQREYVLYVPLVFVTAVWVYNSFQRNVRRPASMIQLTAAAAVIGYSLFVDVLSTLRISLLAVLLVLLLVLFQHRGEVLRLLSKRTRLSITAGFFLMLLVAFLTYIAYASQHIALVPTRVRWDALGYYVTDPPPLMHLWRAAKPAGTVLTIIALGVLVYRKYQPMHLVLFLGAGMLLFYMNFFDRYFRPRYTAYLLPIYIILIAAGLHGVYLLFRQLFPGQRPIVPAAVSAAFVLLVLFNPLQFTQALQYNEYVSNATTTENHFRLDRIISFLEENIDEEDAIIDTIYWWGLQFADIPERVPRYGYSYMDDTRFEDVAEVMRQFPTGWMALDDMRNIDSADGFPADAPFEFADRLVTPVLRIDHATVYRWQDSM